MQAPCIDACVLTAGPTLLILMALSPRRVWGRTILSFRRSRFSRATVLSLPRSMVATTSFSLWGENTTIASVSPRSPRLVLTEYSDVSARGLQAVLLLYFLPGNLEVRCTVF